MLNNRTLFPALFKPAGGGGGGSGQTIQVTELPEAVLSEKNKIYQYIGSTTETLTNGFFYKCIETTGFDWEETEASETYTEVEELPTASAETVGTIYKVDDKYYQTVIALSYSWLNIPVMEVEGGSGISYNAVETEIGTYLGSKMYAKVYTITGVTDLGQSSPVTLVAGFDSICDVLINATLVITQGNIKTIYNGYGIEVDGGGNHALMWNPLKATKSISGITALKLIIVYTKQ